MNYVLNYIGFQILNVYLLANLLTWPIGLGLGNVVKLFLFDVDQALHLVTTVFVRPVGFFATGVLELVWGGCVGKITDVVLINF